MRPANTIFWGQQANTTMLGIYVPARRWQVQTAERHYHLPMAPFVFVGSGIFFLLNAVQMEGAARRLEQSEYNEAVRGAIEFLNAPMPPYEVYVFKPDRFYVPAIEDGVNTRYEVAMD